MFWDCERLENVNINKSRMINMSRMYKRVSNLRPLCWEVTVLTTPLPCFLYWHYLVVKALHKNIDNVQHIKQNAAIAISILITLSVQSFANTYTHRHKQTDMDCISQEHSVLCSPSVPRLDYLRQTREQARGGERERASRRSQVFLSVGHTVVAWLTS